MYYERLEQYSGVLYNNSDNLPIGLTIRNGHCSYNSHCFQNNTKPCLIVTQQNLLTTPNKILQSLKTSRVINSN